MSILDWLNTFGPVQSLSSTEEKPLKETSFRYLGLYFTATWCSYCVKIADKMPQLLAAVNSKGSLFRMLTIRLD
jgi:thiol-disulfide isomerase/thioredoxin